MKSLTIRVHDAYENHRADKALTFIWESLDQANKYVEDTQPFKLVKEDAQAVGEILYALLESCRFYGWMIYPVLPETSRKIFSSLGLDPDTELSAHWNEALEWGGLLPAQVLPKPEPLFPRTER